MLDNGANIHIANNLDGFTKTKDAAPGDMVGAGLMADSIKFYGSRVLEIDGDKGKVTLTMKEIAYVPSYNTNIVSTDLLEEKGVFYNAEKRYIYFKESGEIIGRLAKHHGLRFSIYNPKGLVDDYFAFSSIHNSWQPKLTRVATAAQWHTTMGHPSKEPLRRLQNATVGAEVTDIDTDAIPVHLYG